MHRSRFSLGWALLGAASMAHASTYRVEQFNGSTSLRFDTANSGADLSIPLQSGVTKIVVTAASDVDIGKFTFSGTAPSGTVTLLMGVSAIDTDCRNEVQGSAGRDWEGLDVSGVPSLDLALYGRIGHDLVGPIGTTANRLNRLYRFEVPGWLMKTSTLDGSMYVNYGAGFPQPFTIVCGAINSDARVCLYNGTLSYFECNHGTFAGEVRAVDGSIGDIIVTDGNPSAKDLSGRILAVHGAIKSIDIAGNITSNPWTEASGGPNTDLVGGSLIPIRARGGIGSVVANAIDADFTVAGSLSPNTGEGLGVVNLFKTRTGDFSGKLFLGSVQPFTGSSQENGILIAGNLTGEIHARCRDQNSSSLIRIGGSITSTGKIILDEQAGLTTQVIVNGNNTSSSWTGPVQVGETDSSGCATNEYSLGSSAYYTNTSASLGGGAVGLVPFNLYEEDSSILALSTSLPATSASSPIIMSPAQFATGLDLSYYGPIKARSSGVAPLRFLLDYTMNSVPYAADLTCRTTQTIAPSGTSGSRAARTIRVQGSPIPIGLYRLTTEDPSDSLVLYRCDTDPFTSPHARTFLDCEGLSGGVTNRKVGGFTI